jgi:hypothetical protein
MPELGSACSPVWLALSAFAVALMPSGIWRRIKGPRIWLAPDRDSAAIGSALTGFGCSRLYPGLGAEAVAPRRRTVASRWGYTVFLEVALGFGSPALGPGCRPAGSGSLFPASTLIVLCATAAPYGCSRRLRLEERSPEGEFEDRQQDFSLLAPVPQSIDQQGKSRGGLAAAWVPKMIA